MTTDVGNAEPRHGKARAVVTVAASAIGLSVGFGPLYFGTLTVFLQPVSQEFGWGRAEAALGGVIAMLGLAFGAVLVGRLIDRWGALRVISMSVVLLAGGIVAQSRLGDAFGVFAVAGFAIGFVGAATTPPGYQSVLARAFDGRLGLALGLSGVGMGLGLVVMPILAQALIAAVGWRGAYLWLAGFAAVVGLLSCAVIARFGLHTRREESAGAERIGSDRLAVAAALRDPRFWRLGAMILLVSVFTMGMSIHLVPMLRDAGVSAAAAAGAASLAGIGALLGRIISGVLIDRLEARFVAAAFFLIAASGALLLNIATDSTVALLFTAGLLVGFALGAEGDFMPFFVRRYFSIASFSSVFGILFFLHSIGGVIGPYLFGLTYDRWSSYAPALWAAAAALVLAGLLAISLGSYRSRDSNRV